MAFWNKNVLEKYKKEVFPENADITVTGSHYRLKLGGEIFITSSRRVSRLEQGHCISIPPGQFAFLITKETINIPGKSMGMISLRTSFKFQGLINVSGFHVDPGYKGKLIFSVFNSGLDDIYIREGEELFLLFLSSTGDVDDVETGQFPDTNSQGKNTKIKLGILNSNSGNVVSLAELERRIKSMESYRAAFQTVLSITGILIVLVFVFYDEFKGSLKADVIEYMIESKCCSADEKSETSLR